MTGRRLVEVIPGPLADERLDRVVSLVTGRSRAAAAELVATGAVSVNGSVVTTRAHRLVEGDEVAIDVGAEPTATALVPEPDVEVHVVYEDDDLLVIDKPAGLVVHPGAGNRVGTLVQGLLARYPEIAHVGDDPERPGVVHRLDKDTSGLLLVARSPRAHAALVGMLAAHEVDRRYTTLAWGAFDSPTGMIDAPIGRSAREPTRMTVSTQGREARTRYEVVRAYQHPVDVTLLTCALETGRTHQIRVHLRAIGHPVVGDERYGGVRQSLPVPRIFLHAAALELAHPVTGERLSFTAPLPADLEGVLATLS